MIGVQGLAALSMDALAGAAVVSRATVYRVFPGKAESLVFLRKKENPRC